MSCLCTSQQLQEQASVLYQMFSSTQTTNIISYSWEKILCTIPKVYFIAQLSQLLALTKLELRLTFTPSPFVANVIHFLFKILCSSYLNITSQTDGSGKINFDEFRHLWEKIKSWQVTVASRALFFTASAVQKLVGKPELSTYTTAKKNN